VLGRFPGPEADAALDGVTLGDGGLGALAGAAGGYPGGRRGVRQRGRAGGGGGVLWYGAPHDRLQYSRKGGVRLGAPLVIQYGQRKHGKPVKILHASFVIAFIFLGGDALARPRRWKACRWPAAGDGDGAAANRSGSHPSKRPKPQAGPCEPRSLKIANVRHGRNQFNSKNSQPRGKHRNALFEAINSHRSDGPNKFHTKRIANAPKPPKNTTSSVLGF